MDIAKVLLLIRPGAEWSLRGTTYDDLEWHDKKQKKPTKTELNAGWKKLQALSYRDQRASEYPAIGDQLDALWKGGKDAADMLAKVKAIKDKYPKPDEE